MKCDDCQGIVHPDFVMNTAECAVCHKAYTLNQYFTATQTTGLQAGPKNTFDPDSTPPLGLPEGWYLGCDRCGSRLVDGACTEPFCSMYRAREQVTKTYPRCIKCDAELCEALDRTPHDPPGELVRCIKCKRRS